MFRRELRELILAFFFMSLGGLLLHLRIHPPSKSLLNWIPFYFALMNTLVIPFLFNRRDTVVYAYLFAWATVAVGTVGMAYISITTWKMPVTPITIILKSTFPDILILWAKILIAHKILRHYRPLKTAAKG